MTNELGQKIHRLRKKKDMTLDKLAEISGSSKSYIWELENRCPPRPSAEKLAKIAEGLDVTLGYLFDEKHEIPEEDSVDARFFREYRDMDPATKEKIREMVKLWGRNK